MHSLHKRSVQHSNKAAHYIENISLEQYWCITNQAEVLLWEKNDAHLKAEETRMKKKL